MVRFRSSFRLPGSKKTSEIRCNDFRICLTDSNIKAIGSTIKEVKLELDKQREIVKEERSDDSDNESYDELRFYDKVTRRMSKNSAAGNPDTIF